MGHIKQFTKLSNKATLYWKKTRLSIIIGCFCLIIYLFLFTKTIDIQRIQKSLEGHQQPSITIAGSYHFCTKGSRWKGIVAEQILLAEISGLVAASSIVHVTGLGKIEHNKTSYNFFRNPKYVYEYDTRIDLWEYPAMKKLEKFCLQNNNSFVWYAHSKAASHEHNYMGSWRDVMNYFVLDKWHHCYNLLASTNYVTCGAILTHDTTHTPDKGTYYAGNMWWAKCSHINALIPLEVVNPTDRYFAEVFVTSIPGAPYFNCFQASPAQQIQFDTDNGACTINYPRWVIR